MENQPREVSAAFDAEREHALDEQGGGGVLAEVSRASALHCGSVASRANHVATHVDRDGQLALFDLPGGDTIDWIDPGERRNGVRGGDAAEATDTGDALLDAGADRAVLGALERALAGAREAGDDRPALVVLAASLGNLGRPPALAPADRVSLRRARDEWLRRLDAQQKSESTLVGYRVAIDDLLDWSEAHGRDVLEESGIVDYLRSYRQRASPAQSTYYRRFVLLRRFLLVSTMGPQRFAEETAMLGADVTVRGTVPARELRRALDVAKKEGHCPARQTSIHTARWYAESWPVIARTAGVDRALAWASVRECHLSAWRRLAADLLLVEHKSQLRRAQRRASSNRGSSRTAAKSSSLRASSRNRGSSSTDRRRWANVSSPVSPASVAKHA